MACNIAVLLTSLLEVKSRQDAAEGLRTPEVTSKLHGCWQSKCMACCSAPHPATC